jgi:hypothetical protein
MQTLLAVLDDLFHFARTAVLGVQPHGVFERKDLLPHTGMQLNLHALHRKHTPASSFLLLGNKEQGGNGTLYFIGLETVFLHTDPVVAFDVVSQSVAYGEQVRLLKLGGRWAYVQCNGVEGWVFKDALREQAKDVFPVFEEGAVYDALNEETKKLRLCIHDEFCGGLASLMLTDAEYVTYKLFRKGLSFPWTQERPRTSGTWQKKLRGISGVHMGITPRTGSVMEYVVDDIGYVGYVEAVFPDETLKLSAVGITNDGVYNEVVMRKEEWRELRPVFISVN